ncbi:hypothetical protein KAFR_0C02060 [Kazachstania africana CBS 2517]|uniref:Uncharacterized protein n=1 Tax=Kazachstania africana (strain ATCC 22294 / BCRC 22015 / CBS 2517 / CECT 1963 / NBRC 1671 / NRRL Y-8276) TaxID=1071382 RepID=H2AS49_KAZAF|nr:hypothetical protein KAFR_0C02060 [Kazachstania africana CBS 2517]CCF57199.1 hypothetical protein KAFR_0C02060 [Kazachstania africana CBS 2517]
MFASPCLFEQLPAFQQPQQQFNFPCFQPAFVHSSNEVIFSTSKTEHGLIVTLSKPLQRDIFKKAVEERVIELQQSTKPSYRLVSDIFGNQYYIEDKFSTQKSILEGIDYKSIGRKVAKESFRDYEIELNHSGEELVFKSSGDKLVKTLHFDNIVDDFYIYNCNVEENNDDIAFLKIGIVFKKPDEEAIEQMRKLSEIKRIQKKREQEVRLTEIKEKLLKEQQLRQTQLVEDKHQRLLNEQHQKQLKEQCQKRLEEQAYERQLLAEQYERQKQLEEQERKAALLAEQQQRQQQEQLKNQALEDERSRLNRQRLLQEQIEYQKQLVEEDRQRKIKQQHQIKKIDIDFNDETAIQSDDDDNIGEKPSVGRRRRSSPILEDVQDEEHERYTLSLNKLPKGSSLIDDA